MFISATDRVRSEIEARIVNGTMPPGASLDESQLSELFSVSRTPVREALLQLATLGFVRIIPRSGIFVVPLSARELASLFEVLAQMESLVAKLVIHRINEEQINMLRKVHADGKAAAQRGDVEAFIEYNKAFHEALYFVCGNSFLVEQILHARKRVNPYRTRKADYAKHLLEAWGEHDKLLEAILSKDEATAMSLASRHVLKSGNDVAELGGTMGGHVVFDTEYGGMPRMSIELPRVPSRRHAA